MADKIRIGIIDEMKITLEGIASLLGPTEDIDIVVKADTYDHLPETLQATSVHVLIIVVHSFNRLFADLVTRVSTGFPRVKVLVISVSNDEEAVLRTIKAGAKGFLARDTSRTELIEAIYTLRSGHEYFSNSITVLLLNKYIHKLKTEDDRSDIRSLSSREIEIMKLWGNSLTNKEIADKLFLSVRTVETHKNHIMQKLNLRTSVDLVKFAIRNNIIEL
ncbi:MAG: response regulator transcription factor [Bacteroidales bacterium]|nr:response regulator transcription factor [Bacteroidales bacterium]